MRPTSDHIQQRLTTRRSTDAFVNKVASLSPPLTMLLAWLAGAMFILALAPYKLWPLAVVSPAILYALLLPDMSKKRAFFIGEVYGMGLWSVGAFWLYTSMYQYGGVPMALALLAIAVMGMGMGLFHGFLALLFNHFVGRQPLAFASLWVLQEWMKTWLFTGFPWLFTGYAFTEQYWLSSLAPVAGVFAVSFAAVLLAASLIEVLRERRGYLMVSAALLLLSTALWLINPAWTTAKPKPNLQVSLIQGNIPQDQKWLVEYQYETLAIYAKLSASEWGRDLVVWPESSITMFQTEAWPFITEMVKIAKANNSTWVTGIPYQDMPAYDPKIHPYPPFYNSVIALGAQADGIYNKQRLVPFGEYIPFKGALDLFPNLVGSQEVMNYSRGDSQQVPLSVRGYKLGAAICYEVAYPDTTRRNAIGSDFMLTVSNDAWFGTSAGPLQHLQMVQMRALETGRWFIRATNTGVTAIIDEKGHIVQRAPQFERLVLRGEVEPRLGRTPYVRFGNYPILILIFILLLLSTMAHFTVNSVARSHKFN